MAGEAITSLASPKPQGRGGALLLASTSIAKREVQGNNCFLEKSNRHCRQKKTWSKMPSSRACWSGLSRESVGASFSFKPGVISFKHIANLVMLYLHIALHSATWAPPFSYSSFASCTPAVLSCAMLYACCAVLCCSAGTSGLEVELTRKT